MSRENELVRLGLALGDAADSLGQACRLADGLLGNDPEPGGPGWPAMEALVDRLEAIRKQLVDLPGDEIAGAIKAADEYLDHLSDLADGASY